VSCRARAKEKCAAHRDVGKVVGVVVLDSEAAVAQHRRDLAARLPGAESSVSVCKHR
jgi:hypothetical protein